MGYGRFFKRYTHTTQVLWGLETSLVGSRGVRGHKGNGDDIKLSED